MEAPTAIPAIPRHGIGHDIRWSTLITRMAWMHLPLAGILWFTPTPRLLAICLGSFLLRGICVTMGFHRYFAHRAFKTSRAFQFIMAFLGTATVQHGVLWWTAYHRDHHRFSDKAEDIHSPYRRGFWWSHMGWFLARDYAQVTRWERVQDWARYPELVWMNRHWLVPPALYGAATLTLFGWDGFFWGSVVATMLIWHITFSVNSLTHIIGSRRYPTTDRSKNSLFVALITMGEGWHNNHHYFPHCAPQGFLAREVDGTMAVIWLLEKLGIIWDVQRPDAALVASGRSPAMRVLVALQDAARDYAAVLESGADATSARQHIEGAILSAREQIPALPAATVKTWNAQIEDMRGLRGETLETALEAFDADIHRMSKAQLHMPPSTGDAVGALPSSPASASC